jgi:hypothetical protein
MYLVLSLIQLMIVQSGHHNHSIECTLFNKIHSILWWWCTLCTIISCIRERTRYIRYYDCDVHFVQSSAISGKEQGTFDTMIHSIECTLFFPWYSWWLYKVDITIIVSNAPCSFPDTADDRYIRYYDDDVQFVQSSAISGKEQGTFDTMIVMYTLYSHQLYQGKNKVHSILWLWCTS